MTARPTGRAFCLEQAGETHSLARMNGFTYAAMRMFAAALILGFTGLARAATGGLAIDHTPVRSAMAGQSLTVRISVTGGTPKAVTLLFTTSKDVAPFKVPMSTSGGGVYTGTIPDWQMGQGSELYYYIEARDVADAPEETPWYTVQIRPPQATPVVAPSKVGTAESADEGRSWVKPALIGGGLLAAGGIAYAMSQSGGGGSDSGGGEAGAAAGTYTGTDTTCAQQPDGSSSCNSSGLTITINDQGVVQTSTLRDGQDLQGALSGGSFVLIGDYKDNGANGEIQYVGTVVDRRIVGSIQGSASATSGVVVFSGSFSAVR